MIQVDLGFVLVHMLRASGDDNFVSVKDLNEMSKRIEEVDSELHAYFDNNDIGNLLEHRGNMFSRVCYEVREVRGLGFMRSLGSETLFSDDAIRWFDFEAIKPFGGCSEERDEVRYKELRREIVELVEPGLLDKGYNSFYELGLKDRDSKIYAF